MSLRSSRRGVAANERRRCRSRHGEVPQSAVAIRPGGGASERALATRSRGWGSTRPRFREGRWLHGPLPKETEPAADTACGPHRLKARLSAILTPSPQIHAAASRRSRSWRRSSSGQVERRHARAAAAYQDPEIPLESTPSLRRAVPSRRLRGDRGLRPLVAARSRGRCGGPRSRGSHAWACSRPRGALRAWQRSTLSVDCCLEDPWRGGRSRSPGRAGAGRVTRFRYRQQAASEASFAPAHHGEAPRASLRAGGARRVEIASHVTPKVAAARLRHAGGTFADQFADSAERASKAPPMLARAVLTAGVQDPTFSPRPAASASWPFGGW